MPAKKSEKKEEEAPKKRSRPVVEEVVEEVEETAEVTPEPVVEEVETVIEETPSGKVSVEPDFSNLAPKTDTVSETPTEETTETPTAEVETEAETPEVTEVVEEPAKEEMSAPKDEQRMGFKTIIFITLISALVAAFVSGGVYVYLSGVNKLDVVGTEETQEEAEVSATPSPTASPTPEPEEELDLSEFSVQVLNGSGQIGAAGKGSDSVESVGLTVDDTGNADNYDYEESVVQVKSSVPSSLVDKIVQALEDDGYSVEEGDELKSSNEFDIIVIVGSK